MSMGAAVVGLGVGEAHARAYAALPECRLKWVYDLDSDRAAAFARTIPGSEVAPNFQSILADADIDVVSIASYDDAHFAQVVEALDAGKHVFVEKPLCRTVEELRVIRRQQAAARRQLGSNLVLRAAPLYRWLRAAIRAGDFGDIYAFDGEYLYGRLEKITDGWRRTVEDYSVIEGGGIHLIDLMLWLTGQAPARVTAAGNRFCTAGTEFRYQDYQAATFVFPSTLVGRITANFGCVHHHQHVVRVFGTKATFLYDDQGPRFYTSRAEPARRIDLSPLAESKGALIPSFIHDVIGRVDRADATQHEFDVVSVCIAADRAARTGDAIDVDYV